MERYSGGSLERIDDFMERLAAIPEHDADRIWSICANEVRWLKYGYVPRSLSEAKRLRDRELRAVKRTEIPDEGLRGNRVRGLSVSHRRNTLTLYRAAVEERYGPRAIALRYLRLSASDTEARNDEYLAVRRARMRELRPLVPTFMLATAAKLLDSPTANGIAVGLMFLTGRRPIEVYLEGSFEPIAGDPTHFMFAGQAKSKPGQPPRPAYRIPILGDPHDVMRAFARMRALLAQEADVAGKPLDAKGVNNKAKTYGTIARAAFGADLLEDGPYDLRAAYAEIAYSLPTRPKGIAKNSYFGDILGHAGTDDATSLSYMKFEIVGREDETREENAASIADLISEMEELRDEIEDESTREKIAQRIAKLRDL